VDLNRRLKDRAEFSYRRLNEIPGIKVNRIDGAFYMFPKVLDMKPWGGDDKKFVLDLLKETGVLVVNGSSFDEEFGGGHFRTITLPKTSILADAYEKLEKFMVKRVG
jgi:aspartate/methionine/tyrosine aminotransferase